MTRIETPAASVIIPVYNGAPYLAEAIESVLAQTCRSFEIIVVDDGSTDGSAGIIARYAASVRHCFQENRGTGAARNRGVEAAQAPLLAFLDQDDLWEPGKLKAQMAMLAADTSLDAVFGLVGQFHSPELGEPFRRRVSCPLKPAAGYLPSAMLLRTEAFHRVGPFEESLQLAEWSEWFVRAVECGLRMGLVPEVVTRRRLHRGNKGLVFRHFRKEYPRLLKTLLDRRRTAGFKPLS